MVERMLALLGLPALPLKPAQGTAEDVAAGFVLFFCAFMIAWIGLYVWSIIFIYKDAKARGQNEVLWLVLDIFFFPLVWIIWMIVRPKGPPTQFAYGQPTGMPPPPPPGYGYPPAQPSPAPAQPYPAPAPYAPPSGYTPAPAPAPAPIPPSQSVRCPNCQTIFGYQKSPSGPSRVKCPNCGTEGTL